MGGNAEAHAKNGMQLEYFHPPNDSIRDLLISAVRQSRFQPLSSDHVFTHHPKKAHPRHSMYSVFPYIYPLNYPNVDKYSIH